MAYKKLTLKQIRAIIEETDGLIYVRWSNSIAKDKKRGYSLAYGSFRESGLSCCELRKGEDEWEIARRLNEYQFSGGRHCWIVTGQEVGRRGEDNEPLLTDITVIGKADASIRHLDWRKMELDTKIAWHEERIAAGQTGGDAIARKIFHSSLANLRSERNLQPVESVGSKVPVLHQQVIPQRRPPGRRLMQPAP